MTAEYHQKLLSNPVELKKWMNKQDRIIARINIATIIVSIITISISIALITLRCLQL